MPLRPIILPALLLLAACGQQAAPDEPAVPSPTAEPSAAASLAPIPAPPGHEEDGTIPARFLGVWDYEKGSCDPASDMRMDIKPRSITFYESHGQVTGVGSEGDDALVDLAMEGEGEQWIEVRCLSLSADGTRLEVTDGKKAKTRDEYPRKRCDKGAE